MNSLIHDCAALLDEALFADLLNISYLLKAGKVVTLRFSKTETGDWFPVNRN